MTRHPNDDDRQSDIREARRIANENRTLARQDREERAVAHLIGELQGETGLRYYVNLRDGRGNLTGKIKESRSYFELVEYLIRNGYAGC
jgi:hypothetical protein